MPEREPTIYEKTGSLLPAAGLSGEAKVERGLNDLRLGVLGILVGIGLAFGFGVHGPWWVQFVAGGGSFAVACLLFRWRPSWLMRFVHWLTDE
jgi:hypothetical protein